MIPVGNSVDVYGAKDQFQKWVDDAKKGKHISGPNAYSIKKAFDKAVKTGQDQQDAKKIFADGMAKINLVKGASQSMIIGAARKAIDMHPGAPAKPQMSTTHHDAEAFAGMYKAAEKAGDVKGQKHLLKGIHRQTKAAVQNGFVVGKTFTTISPASIAAMQKGTQLIHHPIPAKRPGNIDLTVVSVHDGDTIEIAKQLKQQGKNPCVLNMANKDNPGGGWKNGARAQEESLFRASNYFLSLDPEENPHLKTRLKGNRYYVPEFGAIYTPGVTVFRDNVSKGFAFVEPFELDMVASAAYDLQHGTVPKKYEENTKEKIRAILRVAAGTGHDTVVLGAFGCGAFDNDANVIARLYKEVFSENEFKKLFTEIVFAVIDDHNAARLGISNLDVFRKELDGFVIE